MGLWRNLLNRRNTGVLYSRLTPMTITIATIVTASKWTAKTTSRALETPIQNEDSTCEGLTSVSGKDNSPEINIAMRVYVIFLLIFIRSLSFGFS